MHLINSHHPRHGLLVILITVVAALGIGGSAFGQSGLPRLITPRQLDEYTSRHLNLSEEQKAVIAALHEQYQADWAEKFNEETKALNESWNKAYTSLDKFTGESMNAAHEEAVERIGRVSARRRAANDMFFDQIEMLLAEEQLARMPRVRNAHERFSIRLNDRGLREWNIDLIAIVEKMELGPEERQAIDLAINDFEPSFVAALRDAAEFNFKREQLFFVALEMGRQNELHGFEQWRNDEAERAGMEADRISFGSQRRMVETNRRGLRMFASVFTPANAAELVRIYRERAYPEVLPDPLHAREVYEQAFASLPALDPDRKAALQEFMAEYERNHDRLTEDFIKEVYERSLLPCTFAVKHRNDKVTQALMDELVKELADAEQQAREVGLEREQLNLAQPKQVRSLLLSEEIALLPKWRYEDAPPIRVWGQLTNAHTPETKRPSANYEREIRRRKMQASTQPAAPQPSPEQPASSPN